MTPQAARFRPKEELTQLAEKCKQQLQNALQKAISAVKQAAGPGSLGEVETVALEAPNCTRSLQTFICEIDRHDAKEVDILLTRLAAAIEDLGSRVDERIQAEKASIFRREKKRTLAESSLVSCFKLVQKTIDDLQNAQASIKSETNKRALHKKRESYSRPSKYLESINTAGFESLGDLALFWENIPTRTDILDVFSHPRRHEDPGDGLIYREEDKKKTHAELLQVRRALQSANHPFSNAQLDVLPNMSSICLILKHMQAHKYIDCFLRTTKDDDSLGKIDRIQAVKIFSSGGESPAEQGKSEIHRLADVFVNEQYRAVERSWGEYPHLPSMPAAQPLPFRIIAPRLGQGSYSEVWPVENAFHPKEVYALKKQISHYDNGTEFDEKHRERAGSHLKEEIAQLQLLKPRSHPHIVAYHRSYKRGQFYGILETLADDNLDSMLLRCQDCPQNDPKEREKLRPSFLRGIGCLSRGLSELHNASRTRHRDIKPANVVYSYPKDGKEENWMWADFGRALHFPEPLRSLTSSGIKWSRPYLAPEIWETPTPQMDASGKIIELEHKHTHGRGADIYSFGIVIFEVLAVLMGERYKVYKHETDVPNAEFQQLRYWGQRTEEVKAWADKQIAKLERGDPLLLVFQIAQAMTAHDQGQRPSINEVIDTLSKDKASYFCNVCRRELGKEARSQIAKDAAV